MAPQPIPQPLPPWARFLLHVVQAVVPNFLLEPLEFLGNIGDVNASANNEWRHVQILYRPFNSTDSADTMITTLDLVNITGGLVDNSWTSGDYTTTDAWLDGMLGVLAGFLSSQVTAYELRYYRRAFTPQPTAPLPPGTRDKPFTVSGPPEHIHPMTHTGTVTASFPGQVAITSTERTTYPRHWGRNYWPMPAANQIAANGQLTPANVDSICQAVHDGWAGLMGAEFFPVVPVTSVQKAPFRGLLGVTAIQVDSVYDVQRKRRAHTVGYKKQLPL